MALDPARLGLRALNECAEMFGPAGAGWLLCGRETTPFGTRMARSASASQIGALKMDPRLRAGGGVDSSGAPVLYPLLYVDIPTSGIFEGDAILGTASSAVSSALRSWLVRSSLSISR